MFKLDLEKAEEPKFQSKRVPEKHPFLLYYIKAFDCVDHNKLENS